jgi:hypothetical protein
MDRSSLDTFFSQRMRSAGVGLAEQEQARALHGLLVAAALEVPPQQVPRRQPSMSHDGNPLLYSLQLDGATSAPAFRLLVEPGGVGVTVAEQIDFSLRHLDAMVGRLGWSRLGPDFNALVRRVLPREATAVQDWWGGLWLGASLGPEGPELRAYFNLRHGNARARWGRVVDALALFATPELEQPFQELVQRVAPVGIPVGLAVSMRRDRIAGLRLYAALYTPVPEAVCAAGALGDTVAEAEVHGLFRSYAQHLGPLPRQGATVAFDFSVRPDGGVEPVLARFKVDLCCAVLPQEVRRQQLRPWLLARHRNLGLKTEFLEEFLEELTQGFGGFEVDYLSLGFREGARQLTTYVRPDGHALA